MLRGLDADGFFVCACLRVPARACFPAACGGRNQPAEFPAAAVAGEPGIISMAACRRVGRAVHGEPGIISRAACRRVGNRKKPALRERRKSIPIPIAIAIWMRPSPNK